MKQPTKRIIFLKKTWTVKALFPVDFIEQSYWPFAYYKLKDEQAYKRSSEVKREWNLKPKDQIDELTKLNNAKKYAIEIGAGIANDDEWLEIEKNKDLFDMLLSQIYALTYGLSALEKYFVPEKVISKDFAELLAIKAKALNVEPYSFMADISKELPELYNPKRYDFNFFILGVGWDRERKEIEKANKKAKQGRR